MNTLKGVSLGISGGGPSGGPDEAWCFPPRFRRNCGGTANGSGKGGRESAKLIGGSDVPVWNWVR